MCVLLLLCLKSFSAEWYPAVDTAGKEKEREGPRGGAETDDDRRAHRAGCSEMCLGLWRFGKRPSRKSVPGASGKIGKRRLTRVVCVFWVSLGERGERRGREGERGGEGEWWW